MLKANDLEIGKMSKARLIPWRHRKFTPPLFRKIQRAQSGLLVGRVARINRLVIRTLNFSIPMPVPLPLGTNNIPINKGFQLIIGYLT
jgi:hypothetical protein